MPNEIYGKVVNKRLGELDMIEKHQVRQTVEFLTEHATRVSPPRNLPIEKVEHQSREREGEC
jgi:hypothetical protein